ncbi:ATP-binding protein [Streptomyces sp. NBC_01260]|uniref:ATP-binding protein n=1 Tax=Streptomyces TaxID=1883 RepID=UPI001F153AE5|nr:MULTISPECIES: ATP-binding protein [Streptomyces]MCX4770679.1 ATP-binding protein [Streptomyces sp. NBC_01285]
MQVLQVQLEVGADPAEVGRARRWARSRLVGSGIGDDEPLAETLILLISELVTNAVVHTGCPAVLRMLFGSTGAPGNAGTVRVEVADTSCRPPQQRHAEGEDTGGRGLELVDGLADRWGWQPEGAGKRIWCEVDRGIPLIQVQMQPCAQGAGAHGAAPCDTGGCDAGGREAGAAYEASHAVTHRA